MFCFPAGDLHCLRVTARVCACFLSHGYDAWLQKLPAKLCFAQTVIRLPLRFRVRSVNGRRGPDGLWRTRWKALSQGCCMWGATQWAVCVPTRPLQRAGPHDVHVLYCTGGVCHAAGPLPLPPSPRPCTSRGNRSLLVSVQRQLGHCKRARETYRAAAWHSSQTSQNSSYTRISGHDSNDMARWRRESARALYLYLYLSIGVVYSPPSVVSSTHTNAHF